MNFIISVHDVRKILKKMQNTYSLNVECLMKKGKIFKINRQEYNIKGPPDKETKTLTHLIK